MNHYAFRLLRHSRCPRFSVGNPYPPLVRSTRLPRKLPLLGLTDLRSTPRPSSSPPPRPPGVHLIATVMLFASPHERDCASARIRRQEKLDDLAPLFSVPFTDEDAKIHDLTLSKLAEACASGAIDEQEVLFVYGKKAYAAQRATNCLSDIMISDLLFNPNASSKSNGDLVSSPHKRPLAGIPISIKDCIDVAGYPTTLGYSARSRDPAPTSAAIVHLLRDAGALLHVKTTVPTGIFGLETDSALFGRTANPLNPDFSPGASTGGGGALLAMGGSMIEIATDIGGSVRLPAAFCGVYGMKASVGRFPSTGARSSTPGLECIPTVASPMARRLEDLEAFWERIVKMKPWNYDHTCVPLPWRPANLEGKKLRFGVLWSDGLVPLSPASKRAMEISMAALRQQGHEVVDFDAPSLDVLKTGFQLAFADGGDQVYAPLQPGEHPSPGIEAVRQAYALPAFVKTLLSYLLPDPDAALLRGFNRKTIVEERELIVEREEWKRIWKQSWQNAGLDFVLSAPAAIPAMPRGGTATSGLGLANYLLLFNILDLPAGVLPVTTVQRDVDALPPSFASTLETDAARKAYKLYDADAMHGLPVGVQVIGERLEEERVLAAMRIVREAVDSAHTAHKACA
ncbi:amidase signature enzyme [Amylostereum chailletii]|nr:amidase signature enzyme [Amylostereum chailletii]